MRNNIVRCLGLVGLLAPMLAVTWWSTMPITPIVVDGDFKAASAVIAADLDNDGHLDIVAAGKYEDTFSWWRNLTKDRWERHNIFTLNGASCIRACDMDGDGDIDLIGCSKADDSVWWFENTLESSPTGIPTFIPHFVLRMDYEPVSVDAGDFDDDGDLDLAVAFEHYPAVIIVPNMDGAGLLTAAATIALPVFGNGVSHVRAIDLDHDGDMDIVAATPWDLNGHPPFGHVNYYWFRNDGLGGFEGPLPIGGGLDMHAAYAVDIADIDGDGLEDLIAMSDDSAANRRVVWFQRRNREATEWSTENLIDTTFAGSDGDHSICAVDVDGDGRVDIIAGSHLTDPRITVWRNLGRGQFERREIEVGFAAHGVAAADLNGDGQLEILGGSWGYYAGKVKYWKLNLPQFAVARSGH